MKFVILFCLLVQQALAGDVTNITKDLNTFGSLNDFKPLCVSCAQEEFSAHGDCPDYVTDSYKNIYKRGTVGVINQIVSDGSLKNPRSACNSSAENIKPIKPQDLYKELQSKYPDSRQLFEVTQKCNQGMDSDKANFATAYMTYDFNLKSHSIQAAMNELIDARAQIDSLVDDKKQVDCKLIHLTETRKHCEELSDCPKSNQKEMLDLQKTQITDALAMIQNIRKSNAEAVEKVGKESSIGRGAASKKSTKIKQLNELRDSAIKSILEVNPLLRGDEFKKIVEEPKKFNDSEIEKSLKKQLAVNKKEINKKIDNFNRAYNCLTGINKRGCGDTEETLKESKFRPSSSDFFKNPNMAALSTFHTCVNTVAEARNDSDKIIDGAIIDAALSLTPMVAVSAVKLAATTSRLAMTAANLARAEGVINNANIATTVAYSGHQTKEVYDQCKNNENAFEGLGAHQKAMKCENLENILAHKTVSAGCAGDAIIAAALTSIPLAMPAVFKAAKALSSKTKAPKGLSQEQKTIMEKAVASNANALKGNNQDALKAFGSASDEQRVAAVHMIKPDATSVHELAVNAAHKVGNYSAEELAVIAKANGTVGKLSAEEVKALAVEGKGVKLTYSQLSDDLIQKKANILAGKEGPLKDSGVAGFTAQERQKFIRLGITGEGDAVPVSKLPIQQSGQARGGEYTFQNQEHSNPLLEAQAKQQEEKISALRQAAIKKENDAKVEVQTKIDLARNADIEKKAQLEAEMQRNFDLAKKEQATKGLSPELKSIYSDAKKLKAEQITEENKLKFLEKSKNLNGRERVEAAEQALDRKLSIEEARALQGAHVIGGNRGFKYDATTENAYTATDLRKKAKALKEVFKDEEERQKLMRLGLAGNEAKAETIVKSDYLNQSGDELVAIHAENQRILKRNAVLAESNAALAEKQRISLMSKLGKTPTDTDDMIRLAQKGQIKVLQDNPALAKTTFQKLTSEEKIRIAPKVLSKENLNERQQASLISVMSAVEKGKIGDNIIRQVLQNDFSEEQLDRLFALGILGK